MIWKKLLLELVAVSGLGGGIGGWFNVSGGGIQINLKDDPILFGAKSELKKEKQRTQKVSQKVNNLSKTTLGSWRWKSEGVGQEFLFVEGWDNAGPHKIIESSAHSQSVRELYGGVKVSGSMSWFGPRKVTQELEDIEKVKTSYKNVSYWPKIKESGKYLDQKDLIGLQKFWSQRSRELEEDIFGLYHDWNWWAKQFGTTKDGKKVELEFDLSRIKEMLNKSEEELRDNPWSYGQLFNNSKLNMVRLLGNVEETAFNYLKQLAWPEQGKVKQLKEKKIAHVILGLILGEEYGFDCKAGNPIHRGTYFMECNSDHIGKIKNGGKVKKVLKTTWTDGTYYYAPRQWNKFRWHEQTKLSLGKEELLKMDDLKNTALLDEKCEKEYSWWDLSYLGDRVQKIRREVCDQIIRPWFGDTVPDKRLCLIEIEDYNYYLRLNTYLQVIDIPTWMNKNTFWTKCSNYSI